jgi:hypothetical protein
VSVDPLAEAPPEAALLNPQFIHVYGYGGNNPVKYVDPDGEFGVATGIGALLGGLAGATVAAVKLGWKYPLGAASKRELLEHGKKLLKGFVVGAAAGAAAGLIIDTAGAAGIAGVGIWAASGATGGATGGFLGAVFQTKTWIDENTGTLSGRSFFRGLGRVALATGIGAALGSLGGVLGGLVGGNPGAELGLEVAEEVATPFLARIVEPHFFKFLSKVDRFASRVGGLLETGCHKFAAWVRPRPVMGPPAPAGTAEARAAEKWHLRQRRKLEALREP